MLGGTFIIPEGYAFGSFFVSIQFTPLYGLNHFNLIAAFETRATYNGF
jgi:hypothetical protein